LINSPNTIANQAARKKILAVAQVKEAARIEHARHELQVEIERATRKLARLVERRRRHDTCDSLDCSIRKTGERLEAMVREVRETIEKAGHE
jgi:cell division septum initiation protein DivIVA